MEGVRSYKRTSDAQHEAISDIMNGKNDKADVTGVSQVAPVPTTTHGHNTNLNFSLPAQSAASCSQPPSTVSSSMLSASQHSQQLHALSLPAQSAASCSQPPSTVSSSMLSASQHSQQLHALSLPAQSAAPCSQPPSTVSSFMLSASQHSQQLHALSLPAQSAASCSQPPSTVSSSMLSASQHSQQLHALSLPAQSAALCSQPPIYIRHWRSVQSTFTSLATFTFTRLASVPGRGRKREGRESVEVEQCPVDYPKLEAKVTRPTATHAWITRDNPKEVKATMS